MSKPTINEIAQMPYPASVEAMRQHYNPMWGKPVPEGVERPLPFTVSVEFTYTTTDSEYVDVDAFCEEEAEDIASELLYERLEGELGHPDNLEILSATAKPRKDM